MQQNCNIKLFSANLLVFNSVPDNYPECSNISKYSAHSSQIHWILTTWIDFDTLGYIMQHEQAGAGERGRHCNLDRNDWSARPGWAAQWAISWLETRVRSSGLRPGHDWVPNIAWPGVGRAAHSRDIHNFHFDQTTIIPSLYPTDVCRLCPNELRRAWVHIYCDSFALESASHVQISTGEAGWPIRPRWPDYCLCLGRDSSIFRNFS